MLKRLLKKFKYNRFLDNYPEFNLGSFFIAILCTFLIIISTFTKMDLRLLSIPVEGFIHPVEFFSHVKSINDISIPYYYLPQVPAILFTAALLGPRLSLFAVALYIIAGLTGFPVFASGGGIKYCFQIVFGYILGYFIAACFVSNILSARVTSFAIIRATFAGVLAVHITGIIYSIIVMILQHNPALVMLGWTWTLSGMQLPYDLIMGFAAIALARPVRGILWVAMD